MKIIYCLWNGFYKIIIKTIEVENTIGLMDKLDAIVEQSDPGYRVMGWRIK